MDSQIAVLDHLIEEGNKFTFKNFCYPSSSYPGQYGGDDKPEWFEWKARSFNIVSKTMANDSPAAKLASVARSIPTSGYNPENFERAKSSFLKALENTRSALTEDVFGELSKSESENTSPALSNKVFIVHGHDSELKNDVERFVHEIGLQPVVLHRQIDAGATIIEKFEKHSDVGYAFILLTPDEIAYTADQELLNDADRKKESRARPNVIFEFGYFVGRLGRNRVSCIHKGDVVIPSDLAGLVYKKIENSIESQAYSIIRELKAAGYKIQV
ncbi:nucleotide-binding protein [Pseudomonas putida]|uniref:nucleotide-binding protein n=1 Tax=Pseudomonas putida TaxID=303 RepID=UPI002167EA8D|nr:nucleotide-binding protein [Pseudomonas putida]MCS4063827.1 putative nucleotide-binding protein [Pseudomonas putida]